MTDAQPPERRLRAHDPLDGKWLPVGFRLQEFEIEGVVGEGGFSVVYLARDTRLQRRVALKEYIPANLAVRQADGRVTERNEGLRDTFALGLRSFINEAQLLASFDHPSLVRVYRFWEENGTAYMVMPYVEAPTLKAWLTAHPRSADEAWLRAIVTPLIDALEMMHASRCFHRDIAPDNVLLIDRGPGQPPRPLLLDLGAARRLVGDATQALTVIVKPGYAPIEQYAHTGGIRQGPWTDVYALCAVMYAIVANVAPVPSASRVIQDTLTPATQAGRGRFSVRLLAAIDAGLAIRPEARPASMQALRDLLGDGSAEATELPDPFGGLTLPHVPASIPVPTPDFRDGPTWLEPLPGEVMIDPPPGRSRPGASAAPTSPAPMPPLPLPEMPPLTPRAAPAGNARAPAAPPRRPAAPAPGPIGSAIAAFRPRLALAMIAGIVALLAIAAGVMQLLRQEPASGGGAGSTRGEPGMPNGSGAPGPSAAGPTEPPATAPIDDAGTPSAVSPPPPSQGEIFAATAPAPEASAPAPVAAVPVGPSPVMRDVLRQADPSMFVAMSPESPRVVIDQDRVQVRVRTVEAGYLYVYMAATNGRIYLLFPNRIDRDNRVEAGRSLLLPTDGWNLRAEGPPGTTHFLAVVSRARRDLGNTAFRTGRAIPEIERRVAEQQWRISGANPLLGRVQCEAGAACVEDLGAAMTSVEEVLPAAAARR